MDSFSLRQVPFIQQLDKSDIDLLLSHSNLVTYNRGDTIIKQNTRTSHLVFINEGLVKISREMRKDKNLIIKIESPGSFIGLSSVFVSETYDYSASALEPVTVFFTDIGIFKQVVDRNGTAGHEIIKLISQANISDINKLSGLLYKQLPGRVADIIIYFSEVIYTNQSFTFPLTRQELAELAGTTKESLIRTLSEFKHDKIIELERNTLTVLSPKIIHTLSKLG